MSGLTDFYRGQSPDFAGRHIDDVWSTLDDELKLMPGSIQWLFPLPESFLYEASGPLLTEEDISTFRTDETIQANLRKSFERVLTLLGLDVTRSGEVVEGPDFSMRRPDVWETPNRKFPQLARILQSLNLLGLECEAEAIYRTLKLPTDLSPSRQAPWRR